MAETKLPASQIVDADIITEAELNAGTKPASFTTLVSTGYSGSYAGKSADYTLTSTDFLIEVTAINLTITLPTAVGRSGMVYIIKSSVASPNLTIATTGGQTIDGSSTQTITTQYGILRIFSNGANWLSW